LFAEFDAWRQFSFAFFLRRLSLIARFAPTIEGSTPARSSSTGDACCYFYSGIDAEGRFIQQPFLRLC
jgi:hypothetical protein